MPKRKAATKPKRRFYYAYRSAISGNFVSPSYAKKHPETTIRQRIYFDQLEVAS